MQKMQKVETAHTWTQLIDQCLILTLRSFVPCLSSTTMCMHAWSVANISKVDICSVVNHTCSGANPFSDSPDES